MLEDTAFSQSRQAQEGVRFPVGRFEALDTDVNKYNEDRSVQVCITTGGDIQTKQVIMAHSPIGFLVNGGYLVVNMWGLWATGYKLKENTNFHIVATLNKSESKVRLYVAADYVGEHTRTDKAIVYGKSVVLGNDNGSEAPAPFAGEVRGSRIFNYALSAPQVAALWNNGKPEQYVLPAWMKRQTPQYTLDFSTSIRFGSATYSQGVLHYTNANSEHPSLWAWGTVATLPDDIDGMKGFGYFKIDVTYKTNFDVTMYFGFSPYPVVINAPVTQGRLLKDLNNVTVFIPTTNSNALGGVWYGLSKNFSAWLYRAGVITIPEGTLDITITSISVRAMGMAAEYLPQNIVAADGSVAWWLDSAQQLPINDEYLPPLLQSIGGYDLTASGSPEVVYKPTLIQRQQITKFTGEGLTSVGGVNNTERIATVSDTADGVLLHCFGDYRNPDGLINNQYPRLRCNALSMVGGGSVKMILHYQVLEGNISVQRIETYFFSSLNWTNIGRKLSGSNTCEFISIGRPTNTSSIPRIDFGGATHNGGSYKILITKLIIEEYD